MAREIPFNRIREELKINRFQANLKAYKLAASERRAT